MKKQVLLSALAFCMSTGVLAQNPFLQPLYGTPYEIPPFDKITMNDYREALLKGLDERAAEIKAICDNSAAPTFENTILALEKSGALLTKVQGVFSTLSSSNSDDHYRALQREMNPRMTAASDDINLNETLFARVKAVYENRLSSGLNKEQIRLTEKTYKRFERSGANLNAEQKAILREYNNQLSALQLDFSQNLLHETNNTYVTVDDVKDLEGLPESNIRAAAAMAEANGLKGKYQFNMQRVSCNPVIQYCKNREVRRKVYEAYYNRGNRDNQWNNKENARKVFQIRLKKARLLGYEDYASVALDERMAKTSDRVYALLNSIWEPAVQQAEAELNDIRAEIKKDGFSFEPEGWDYMYYLDRAKKAKFNIDDAKVSEYLEINNVQQGIFYVANKLYGISFKERTQDYPVYEPTAKSWDVIDRNGEVIAVFYSDFFPRDGKGAGAWCGGFRGTKYQNGERVIPIVTNVCNMNPASGDKPALQTVTNVETMFHEFGHALHSFFRDVHYSGTGRTEQDFVELPSQINEHWAFEPEVLKVYAKHYQTGEVIPMELVEKVKESANYGQGFATTELVAASLTDMDFHTMREIPDDLDVMEMESRKMAERGAPRQILPRYRVTNFSHIMGGYSAGYYSYLWSEVLDCDAYQAFKETGDIFNQEVAQKFRQYVLSPGGIDDGMTMYTNFRGKEPNVDALLENRGLTRKPHTVRNADIEKK